MIASMRQIGAIAAHYLRRVALDAAPLWLVAMPLTIIYVLGITMHGLFSTEFTPAKPYRIVVASAEETSAWSGAVLSSGAPAQGEAAEVPETAQHIAEQLSQAPGHFAVNRVAGGNDARRAVLEREADAAIIVRREEPAFTIIAAPGSVVAEMLAAALQRFDEERVSNSGLGEQGLVDEKGSLEASGGGDAALDAPWTGAGAFQYFSVAITVMFMTFASHSAMTYAAEDRSTGAYLRIRSMGISRLTFMVAEVASAVLIGAAFALLMAVITRMLFRVTWGDPVAWTLMTIGGAMSIAALSFLVMTLLPDNPKSVESAGSTVYTILSFLGGSTVPLTIMPPWFARLFSWLPNRRMLDGYLAIAQGAGVESLGRELLGLAVVTLALFAVSWFLLLTFKKEVA